MIHSPKEEEVSSMQELALKMKDAGEWDTFQRFVGLLSLMIETDGVKLMQKMDEKVKRLA